MYLQYHGSKGDANKGNNILFYALCLLYILSVATFASDVSGIWVSMVSKINISFTVLTSCAEREPDSESPKYNLPP